MVKNRMKTVFLCGKRGVFHERAFSDTRTAFENIDFFQLLRVEQGIEKADKPGTCIGGGKIVLFGTG